MPLEEEFQDYLVHQEEIVARHNGEFVVIKGGKVIGVFPDELTAVSETAKTQELDSFLVQKVEPGTGTYTQTFHSRVALA